MLEVRVLPDALVTLQLYRHDAYPWALLSSPSVDHHSHWYLGPCPVHTYDRSLALDHCPSPLLLELSVGAEKNPLA